MSRSPSPVSPRKASPPPPSPSESPPTEQPRKTSSSLSFGLLPSSLSELLRASSFGPQGRRGCAGRSPLSGVKRRRDAEASGSLVQAQFPGNSSSFWEQDMSSRSTQTDPEADSGTQTGPHAYLTSNTSDRNEGPRYMLQRMTGASWSPNMFLISLVILSVVVFTLAVVTTTFGTASPSKKMDNLELIPNAIEKEPAAAHEQVAVTAPTTSTHARRTATVVRRKAASEKRSSRKAPGTVRKATRGSSRRLKSKTHKRGSLFSTSLPSSNTDTERRPEQLSSTTTVRRPSPNAADDVTGNVTRRGILRVASRNEPTETIMQSDDENVIAAAADDQSPAPTERTSYLLSTSPVDDDVEEIV